MIVAQPVDWRTPNRGKYSIIGVGEVLAQVATKCDSPERIEPLTSGYLILYEAHALRRTLKELLLRHMWFLNRTINYRAMITGPYGTWYLGAALTTVQPSAVIIAIGHLTGWADCCTPLLPSATAAARSPDSLLVEPGVISCGDHTHQCFCCDGSPVHLSEIHLFET